MSEFRDSMFGNVMFRAVLGALAVAAAHAVPAAAAGGSCFSVSGRYEERATGPAGCTSPVGFCFAGEFSGAIKGTFSGRALTLTPVAETAPLALLFTSESSIDARVHGRRGTLLIRNAGAFQSAGAGNIVDLQTIVGGTGELSGATGALRASGIFDPVAAVGSSSYEGTVCLP